MKKQKPKPEEAPKQSPELEAQTEAVEDRRLAELAGLIGEWEPPPLPKPDSAAFRRALRLANAAGESGSVNAIAILGPALALLFQQTQPDGIGLLNLALMLAWLLAWATRYWHGSPSRA